MRLAILVLCVLVAGLLAGVVTARLDVALVASGCVVAAAVAIRIGTFRGLLAAGILLTVAPGTVGESMFAVNLIGLAAISLLVLTFPTTVRPPSTSRMLVAGIALCLCFAIIGFSPDVATVAVAYLLVLVAAQLAMSRPDFVTAMLKGIALIVALMVISYAITLILGFAVSQITTFPIGVRNMELYAPFTFATGGPPWIPGTRRLTLTLGEPGLVAYLVVPIGALALSRRLGTTASVALLILATTTICFSQSLGALLAFVIALAVAAAIQFVRRRRWTFVALLATASIAALVVLVPSVLDEKSSVAAVSLTYRGFGRFSDAEGTATVLTALTGRPAMAIFLLLALVLLFVLARRSPAGWFAVSLFAMTSFFAQPSQWQYGAWFIVIAATAWSASSAVSARTTNTPRPEEGVKQWLKV